MVDPSADEVRIFCENYVNAMPSDAHPFVSRVSAAKSIDYRG